MSTLHTAGSFSGASDKPKIALDIVRLKKLPQSEDEALPCSASVRLSCLLLRDFKVETETQKGTNNPYYNYSTDVALPENYAAMDKITFIIEVVEHARKPTPQTILYGNVVIPLVKADPGKPEGKVELSVFLTAANPGSSPEEAAAQEAAAQKLQQDVPTATLRYKIHIPKPKKEAVDPHADVVIDSFPIFDGRHRLVPADCQYVWLSMIHDFHWQEKFKACVVEMWKNGPHLLPPGVTKKSIGELPGLKKPVVGSGATGGRTPRGGAEKGAAKVISSLADVVTDVWYCRRAHQVISRLRLAGEKFNRGEPSVTFTYDEEMPVKRVWKERALLRVRETRRSYEASSSLEKIRSSYERLWMLFVLSIPAEGPAPIIGYEQRHKLNQAAFTTKHCEVLLACLLFRYCSALPYSLCEALAKDDADPRVIAHTSRGGLDPVPDVKMQSQLTFVEVVSGFVGRIMDTLTDTEHLLALEAFIPAIRDASAKCAAIFTTSMDISVSAGAAVGSKAAKDDSAKKSKLDGDGIEIKNLDKLGRRTVPVAFAGTK